MNRRNALKLTFAAVISPVALISTAHAKSNKGPTYVDKKGRAIKGYDTVAYFTQNKPVEGSAEFQYKWNHGIWFFSSQKNLDLFKSAPEKYAPQYGGYCAYAIAIDRLISVDPTQFTVLNDKLYLNYSPRIQRRWEKNRDAYLSDSEKNWPALLEGINATFKG